MIVEFRGSDDIGLIWRLCQCPCGWIRLHRGFIKTRNRTGKPEQIEVTSRFHCVPVCKGNQ